MRQHVPPLFARSQGQRITFPVCHQGRGDHAVGEWPASRSAQLPCCPKSIPHLAEHYAPQPDPKSQAPICVMLNRKLRNSMSPLGSTVTRKLSST